MQRRRIQPTAIHHPRAPEHPRTLGARDTMSVVPGYGMPLCDWALLSEALQLAVAREALARAAETIAGQAMVLAEEMDGGVLPDRGGAEALRLFAAVVRVTGREASPPAGHA